LRYLILAAFAAFAITLAQEPAYHVEATCEGDMDCEEQCRANLQPDEDESICDVEA
jgi:hypothetical protein